ncbi:MAG: hypothetical protein AAF502_19540 [Bacteroidota bacterium]
MAFFSFKCPKEDPLLKMLRDTYNATPLRIPDSTTKVLDIIAHRGRKSMRYGPIKPLLGIDSDPEITESPLPDLALVKSNDINLKFGLGLMSQMLKGFGFPGGDLSSTMNGVEEISISIEDLKKIAVAPTAIGQLLHGKTLDDSHPAAHLFTRKKEKFELLVITNILVGKKISFTLKGSGSKEVDVNVEALKGKLKATDIDLKTQSSNTKNLVFEGPEPLTFAFSCIELTVDEAKRAFLGEIINPPVPKSVGSDEMVPGPSQPKEISLMHASVPALMEFDDAE